MKINKETLNKSKEHYLAVSPLLSLLNKILSDTEKRDFLIAKAKEIQSVQINNEYELILNFAELLSSSKYTQAIDEFKVKFGNPIADEIELMKKEAKAHKRYFSFVANSMFSVSKHHSHLHASNTAKVDFLEFSRENGLDEDTSITSFIHKITTIDHEILNNLHPYELGQSIDGYYDIDTARPLLSSAIPALSIILELPAEEIFSLDIASDIKNQNDLINNFNKIVTDEKYEAYREHILSKVREVNEAEAMQLNEAFNYFSGLPETTRSKSHFLLFDIQNDASKREELLDFAREQFIQRGNPRQKSVPTHLASLSEKLSILVPKLQRAEEFIEVDGQKFIIDKVLSSGGASYKNYIVHSGDGETFIVKLNSKYKKSELTINADKGFFYKHCNVQTPDGVKQALFMRPAKGTPLNTLIKKSNLDSNFAEHSQKRVDYVVEALEAMVKFHRAGLVHGDTLPANLFYDHSAPKGDKVNFIDFDEAEFASALSTEKLRERKAADISRLSDGLAKTSGSFDYDPDLLPIDKILEDLKDGKITLVSAIDRIKAISAAIEHKDFAATQQLANQGNLYSKGRFIDSESSLGGISFTLMDNSILKHEKSSNTALTNICMPFYKFLRPNLRTFLPVVATINHIVDGKPYKSLILKYTDSGKDVYFIKPTSPPFEVSTVEEYKSLSDDKREFLAKLMASAQTKVHELFGRVSNSEATLEVSCAAQKSINGSTLHSSLLGRRIHELGRIGDKTQFSGRNLDEIGPLGHPPVVLACEYNQDDLVIELINAGADLDLENKYGNSFKSLTIDSSRRERFNAAIEAREREVYELINARIIEKFTTGTIELTEDSIRLFAPKVLEDAILSGDNEIVRNITKPPFSVANEELLEIAKKANNSYAVDKISKAITHQKILDYANNSGKKTVLHASLEYVHGVGGLKEASTGLISALNARGEFAVSAITPYWDFLDDDPDFKRDTALLGTVEHVFKGNVVKSNIYGHLTEFPKGSGQRTVQYLIRPVSGSPVGRIFDIKAAKNIYSALDHTEPLNRLEYYNGAMASFVKKDNDFSPTFDAFHSHGWHSALSHKAMVNFDDINRKISDESNIRETPTLFHTIHMLTKEDLGYLESDACFVSMGLKSEGHPVELQKEALLYTDMVNHVAKKMADWVLQDNTKACGHLKIFEKLNAQKRMTGITNGINLLTFSPGNPRNLDGTPMNITYTKEDDILTKRQESKNYLKSLLDEKNPEMSSRFDPNKPMLLYVGRYAKEKGIDALRAAALKAKSLGMQFVAMGIIASGDSNSRRVIDELKSDPELKDYIVVLDEWVGETNQKSLGKYFRQAAEFTIVPSHSETCGLVPMESLQCGSIPITSNVQGLPDVITEITHSSASGAISEDKQNGFVFDEHNPDQVEERTVAMEAAIQKAYEFHMKSMEDKVSYNRLLQGYMQKSEEFAWDVAAARGYEEFYRHGISLTQSQLYDQLYLDEEFDYSPVADSSQSKPDLPIVINSRTSSPTPVPEIERKKIMHCSLEYGSDATLGGLGSVVTQLSAQQAANGDECSVITPLYPINDSPEKIEVATIEHFYNGEKVTATIYKRMHSNGVTQYLVEPCNHEHKKLFEVKNKLAIYSNNNGEGSAFEKIKYFDSAVSAFVNSLGPDDQPNILQTHGWQTGLTAKFLKEREKNDSVKVVNTVHVGNTDCGGPIPKSLMNKMGLKISRSEIYAATEAFKSADRTVSVSNGLKQQLVDKSGPNAGVAHVYHSSESKITPIINGIDHSRYNPSNLGIGFNPMDPKGSKDSIRRELFKRGGDIVGTRSVWSMDPELPVVLFVGRFSPEKGTDEFRAAVEACRGKANLVFMGRGMDGAMSEFIEHPEPNVKVILSSAEQEALGSRIRACADIQFVPSHAEACGLVAMEGQSSGAITVSSDVGGLKDIVKDLRVSSDKGNGLIYAEGEAGSLTSALATAIDIVKADGGSLVQRVYNEAEKYDWKYTCAEYDKLYEDLVPSAHLRETSQQRTSLSSP